MQRTRALALGMVVPFMVVPFMLVPFMLVPFILVTVTSCSSSNETCQRS